ncbi:oxygen-dependent coproporphyrinogen oxidase [bacterium]|nr:oxygen-dependent coproporphyrinogen oxidase [bacterium]
MAYDMALWVQELQTRICHGLESFETDTKFHADRWDRQNGGGGVTQVIQDGATFEKGGVNTSVVYGPVKENEWPMFRKMISQQGVDAPESPSDVHFFATGLSLVIHPKNPNAPTTHANYRYFEIQFDGQEMWWFGGGADLTPHYLFEEDAKHFHMVHKTACDKHDPDYYVRFKKWCDTYFTIPHRNETRGIGGLFFDYQNDRSKEDIFAFVKDCGDTFLDAYTPIIEKRHRMAYDQPERTWQEIRRGRYVEFNLVYDRGTQFGLQTGGRIESILMSLPAHVQWQYDHHPEPGSPEADLVEVLQNPRDWV